jgi:hypothetical protein
MKHNKFITCSKCGFNSAADSLSCLFCRASFSADPKILNLAAAKEAQAELSKNGSEPKEKGPTALKPEPKPKQRPTATLKPKPKQRPTATLKPKPKQRPTATLKPKQRPTATLKPKPKVLFKPNPIAETDPESVSEVEQSPEIEAQTQASFADLETEEIAFPTSQEQLRLVQSQEPAVPKELESEEFIKFASLETAEMALPVSDEEWLASGEVANEVSDGPLDDQSSLDFANLETAEIAFPDNFAPDDSKADADPENKTEQEDDDGDDWGSWEDSDENAEGLEYSDDESVWLSVDFEDFATKATSTEKNPFADLLEDSDADAAGIDQEDKPNVRIKEFMIIQMSLTAMKELLNSHPEIALATGIKLLEGCLRTIQDEALSAAKKGLPLKELLAELAQQQLLPPKVFAISEAIRALDEERLTSAPKKVDHNEAQVAYFGVMVFLKWYQHEDRKAIR